MAAKDGTRERIIKAAAGLLDLGGESRVRMEELARIVGVREPSIYHHFHNREDVLIAAETYRFRLGLSDMTEKFANSSRRVTSSGEFVGLVQSLLREIFTEERAPRRRMRISVIGSAIVRPELLQVVNDEQHHFNNRLAEVFDEAQLKGWIREEVSTYVLSAWIFSLIISRTFVELDKNFKELDVWDDLTVDAIVRSIQKS